MTSSTSGANTCANCFAEFDWEPFTQDGVDFCCAGCADGGPCICTYDGAPHVTEAASGIAILATDASSEESSSDSDAGGDADLHGEPAAVTPGDGGGDDPPVEPPAPGHTPEEEPPTNGRLAVIMAAVSEMPLPVQEVVTARLSTEGSDAEIGERLGLTGEEVRALISQGQAILDRILGPDFTIRFIAATGTADQEAPESEFPSFDQAPEQIDEQAVPELDDRASDLGQLIASSVDSLTRASAGEGTENEENKKTLSEALREAGNLFRLASERLLADSPPDVTLRAAMADARDEDEPITLIVENPGDVSPLMMALQAADSVRLARLESLTTETAVFRLVISSMMELVRDLMAQEGRLRPARVQMATDEITIELPVVAAESPAGVTGAAWHPSGERFELTVDSFFGARHFIESGNNVGPPHHHSYRVEASFASSQPDRHGFVLGFARVRELVESTVMDYSETLLNTEEPFLEIPPTTENLAKVFHQKIADKLRELNQSSVQLKHVRVWESPSNSATYTDFGEDAAITA